jgi:diguanylate cyclase (GGDEF)-like protein
MPAVRSPTATGSVLLRGIAAVCALVLAAYAVQAQAAPLGAAGDTIFGDVLYNVLIGFAGVLCLARAYAGAGERIAWGLLGASLLVQAAGEVYWTLALSDLTDAPYPSVADAMWLAAYPLRYAALIVLVRARLRGVFRSSYWLDAAIAACAVAAGAAALVFPAVLETTGGSVGAVATNLAYPVFDFLLLALAVGMLALSGWRPGRAWALLAAGFAVTGVADCIYLYQAARGTYIEHTLLDPLWPLGALLVAAAAWQRAPARRILLDDRRIVVVPSLFAIGALALLLLDHARPITTLAIVLAAATIVLSAFRMALVFRENVGMLAHSRREALTDALTGLGNRRRLLFDLDEIVATASRRTPRVLAIFDLDGFKRYNDSYGHPAGDALLARLGGKLGAAARPYGSAYRMGGDEFCVLIRDESPGADAILAGCKAALSEGGEGFAVVPSVGSVEIPGEATEASQALQVADRRMYAQKDRQSPSASRQTCDALMRMLREREPDLYEHLHGVGELAVSVGRRLGLESEDLDVVCRAAEMHDIGKMAVPDAILTKAGPLNEDEWAYMRRHTLIGERILAAVPALLPVARLVRSSHERWDGTGYPDGLRGEQIPLGARVVAVCDAYDAMVSYRPYRDGMPPTEALAELRRCAGTQFDPRVIEAFCTEIVPPPLPEAPAGEPEGAAA